MDLTTFQYITEIPKVIDNVFWAEMAIRAYNLGLFALWFIIFWFIFETIFTCFSKFYKRGHD